MLCAFSSARWTEGYRCAVEYVQCISSDSVCAEKAAGWLPPLQSAIALVLGLDSQPQQEIHLAGVKRQVQINSRGYEGGGEKKPSQIRFLSGSHGGGQWSCEEMLQESCDRASHNRAWAQTAEDRATWKALLLLNIFYHENTIKIIWRSDQINIWSEDQII